MSALGGFESRTTGRPFSGLQRAMVCFALAEDLHAFGAKGSQVQGAHIGHGLLVPTGDRAVRSNAR